MSRKLIPGLSHKYPGYDKAEFFAEIDALGGWPLGYKYVGFVHSSEREAGFCMSPLNDGWWTVVAAADDYYLWKLSPETLQRLADNIISSVRVPKVDVSKLFLYDSRGGKATIAKTPPVLA